MRASINEIRSTTRVIDKDGNKLNVYGSRGGSAGFLNRYWWSNWDGPIAIQRAITAGFYSIHKQEKTKL